MTTGGPPSKNIGPTQGWKGDAPGDHATVGSHVAPPHTDKTKGASPRPAPDAAETEPEPAATDVPPPDPAPERHAATQPNKPR